jgi:nitrogen-specific signal transduction histidine kinase
MDAAKLQALGKFTAGVAHKINNSLGIISGNAQYLLARIKEKDCGSLTEVDLKEIRDSLNSIMEKGDCLGAITKKILEFTAEAKSRKKERDPSCRLKF